MIEVIKGWFNRYFSDPQAVLLAAILILGTTIILTMGNMLTPVLAAVVIAYLLEGLVRKLESVGLRRIFAVVVVFILFNAFVGVLLFGVIPLLSTQVTTLARELPKYLETGRSMLIQLPEHYSFISGKQIQQLVDVLNREVGSLGQTIFTLSLSSIPGIITIAVYLILVPMLIFFFLKDKVLILNWFSSFLPQEHRLVSDVWEEMNRQLGNYVRGKFWEILIVGVITYIGFAIFSMKYAILLATLVGISVLVPYIGATVVTIPVLLVAYFQWGWSTEFAMAMIVYGVIQMLDGNLLVPLLFSEVVNLHPIAIIVSVLVFGGLWGFWGIFFAIPLATLVNAVIRAWPRDQKASA
ncbi:Putative permease PerM (= YfgO) [hydrothermal vent metagenome]|uniref:Permease PerM (= YfgO) n=1 Tax=hydrothermal vent metagenome TaxID=652676 RepID=A0A3B1BLP6_9ZZZZ